MAWEDKNILITPNVGSNSNDPKIEFTGANATANSVVTLTTSFDGTNTSLAITGGQLTTDTYMSVDGLILGRGGPSTTSSTNTAFGLNANAVSTSSNNTAIGRNANTANVQGFENTVVGAQALSTATNVDRNTAIGYLTLNAVTTDANTALGWSASRYQTTGAQNTAIGYSALELNETGNYNVMVGYRAMDQNVDGDENVGVGHSAFGFLASGDKNTALGHGTGSTLTSGSNNLLLGWNAEPTSATSSNEIVIGNTQHTSFDIPGVGFSISSTEDVTVGGALVTGGAVGVGTSNPSTQLQVIDDSTRVLGDEHQLTHSALDLFVNWESDTVGKGPLLTFSDNYFDGNGAQRTTRAGIKGVTEATGNTAVGSLVFYTNDSPADSLFERMIITSTGKVGIGTNNPDGLLHISGGTGSSLLIIEADTDDVGEADHPGIWFKQDGDITESAIRLGDNQLQIISNVGTGGGIEFYTGTTSNSGTTDPVTGATKRLEISSGGDIFHYSGESDAILRTGRDAGQHFELYTTDNTGYIRYRQDEVSPGTNDHTVRFEILSSSDGANEFTFNRPVRVTGTVFADQFEDNGFPLSRESQKTYTTATFGVSGSWYTLFEVTESNAPVYVRLKNAAHSTSTFVVTVGYGPSNTAYIHNLASTWTQNGAWPGAAAARVVRDDTSGLMYVQIKLTYSSISAFTLYCSAWGAASNQQPPTFESALAPYTASNTLLAEVQLDNSVATSSASTSGSYRVGGKLEVNSGQISQFGSFTIPNGQAYLSTDDYGTNQGDNRTHFGYYDSTAGTYLNYIRGDATLFSTQAVTVQGLIDAGDEDTVTGSRILAGRYNSDTIATWGGQRSSGGPVMGYGVWPATTGGGGDWVSSSGVALERSAFVLNGDIFQWYQGTGNPVIAESDPVSMSVKMSLSSTDLTLTDAGITATGGSHTFGGNVTGAVLRLKATDTAGAPASTTIFEMTGYEGRGIGTKYLDTLFPGEEWFSGIIYNNNFNGWAVGYDEVGGQSEYIANSKLFVSDTGFVSVPEVLAIGTTGTVVSDSSQLYIKKRDENTNLQRWGEGDVNDQNSYRFRVDQDFKFIANSGSGDNVIIDSSDGEVTASRLVLTSTADAALASTTHALQIGPSNSANIIMDSNEIMARTNGANASLNFQADGGDVYFRNNQTGTTGLYMSASLFLDQSRNAYLNTVDCTSLRIGGVDAPQRTRQNINLAGLSQSNFYPVVISQSTGGAYDNTYEFTMSQSSQSGSDPYNNNMVVGWARPQGYSDMQFGYRFEYNVYDSTEKTILGIYRTTGNQRFIIVYLRGGENYFFHTESVVTAYTTGFNPSPISDQSSAMIKNSSGADIGGQTGTSTRISLLADLFNDGVGLYTNFSTHQQDINLASGHVLTRGSHDSGHLEGSYNNIGENSARSNPIYTIGSNYNPSSDTLTLSNMYGIGYTNTNASFIGFADADGWGLYAAADGNARIFLNATTGSVCATGNVLAYASDARLKTNIQNILNPIDKVKKIRGVEYDWIDDITSEYDFHPTKPHEVGVLAQEIQEVLPEAVSIAPFNGNYTQKSGTDHEFLTVDYERIVPLLIEAIKEQQQVIEDQQETINNINDKLDFLMSAIYK